MTDSAQGNPSKHGTPSTRQTADFPVRRMDFEFDDAIPLCWMGDDPIPTMVLTGLSATFPEGERMFMRSVRHYQERLKDPELQANVRAFIGQEAHHGKEHEAFNRLMQRKGLPVHKIDRMTKEGLAYQWKRFGAPYMLAKTCALEHFTAMFAELLLENPQLLAQFDERLQPLWLWHAIEESEHKAVAFDVYQDQVGDYWLRVGEMALTTALFTFFSVMHGVQLMAAQPGETVPKISLVRNAKQLWTHRRKVARLGARYLDYYRRDFHPNQHDSSFLRRRGLKVLERLHGKEKAAVAAS